MLQSKIQLAACICLCLLVAACGRPEYEYADNHDVKIEDVRSRAIDGDFLEITAIFRSNGGDERKTSYYRVDWFDKDGFIIEQTSWRALSIRGATPVPVRERSTKPGVKDFTITVSNKAY